MFGFVTAVGASSTEGGIALVRGMIGLRKYLNRVVPETTVLEDAAAITRGSMAIECEVV
jgi:hypothetical protein